MPRNCLAAGTYTYTGIRNLDDNVDDQAWLRNLNVPLQVNSTPAGSLSPVTAPAERLAP